MFDPAAGTGAVTTAGGRAVFTAVDTAAGTRSFCPIFITAPVDN